MGWQLGIGIDSTCEKTTHEKTQLGLYHDYAINCIMRKIRKSKEKFESFRTAILEPLQSHFSKIAHKVVKSKYFSNI